MWFKNLQLYRLTAPWIMSTDALELALSAQIFQPCSSTELFSIGWASPRDNGRLVHAVGGHRANRRRPQYLQPMHRLHCNRSFALRVPQCFRA